MNKIGIILFAGGMIVAACAEKDSISPEPLLSYPLEPGSEWVYSREFRINYYASETSSRSTGWDSTRQEIRVWIGKDTLVRDTIHLTRFLSQVDGAADYSCEYYRMDQQGLTKLAYWNPGLIVFVKRSNPITQFWINSFSLSDFVLPEIPSGEMYFYPTPRLSLKLPLDVGSTWTYLYWGDSSSVQINKEVTGSNQIKTKAGSFNCFRISYSYFSFSSATYNQSRRTDWVSKEGLVKREINLDRFRITFENGVSAYAEVSETLVLKELNLPGR